MNEIDVTVIGGGLAGMAASIHLARAGMCSYSVLERPRRTEMLSASRSIGQLQIFWRLSDLPMEELIRAGNCDVQAGTLF